MQRVFVLSAAALVLIMGFCGLAFAQINTEFTDDEQNGRWSDAGNWDNGRPTDQHNAIIPNGLTCIIDDFEAVCSRFTIIEGAVLSISTNDTLRVAQTHGTSIAEGCKVVLGRAAELNLEGGGVITLDGTIEDVNTAVPEQVPASHVILHGDHTYLVRGGGAFVGNGEMQISPMNLDPTLVLSKDVGIYGYVKVRPALINLGTVNPDNTFSQDLQTSDRLELVCRPKVGTGTWRADCSDCTPDADTPNKLIIKTPVLGTGNLEVTEFAGVIADGLARIVSLFGDFELTGAEAVVEVKAGVIVEVDRDTTQNCP